MSPISSPPEIDRYLHTDGVTRAELVDRIAALVEHVARLERLLDLHPPVGPALVELSLELRARAGSVCPDRDGTGGELPGALAFALRSAPPAATWALRVVGEVADAIAQTQCFNLRSRLLTLAATTMQWIEEMDGRP